MCKKKTGMNHLARLSRSLCPIAARVTCRRLGPPPPEGIHEPSTICQIYQRPDKPTIAPATLSLDFFANCAGFNRGTIPLPSAFCHPSLVGCQPFCPILRQIWLHFHRFSPPQAIRSASLPKDHRKCSTAQLPVTDTVSSRMSRSFCALAAYPDEQTNRPGRPPNSPS